MPKPSHAELTRKVAELEEEAARSERRRIEERLQESEGRFRRILKNVDEISIQDYDEERRLTFWNPASEKLYGFSERETQGRRQGDVLHRPRPRQCRCARGPWSQRAGSPSGADCEIT